MIFTALVFLAAFALEAIGSYVSIVGLSALFAANAVVIILAGTLDFAKIVGVSYLYKYWNDIGLAMKSYLTIAMIVLMSITSAGAFGFLSGEFQKAIADTGTQTIKITTLEEEKGRLQKRKEEIDAQIAKVPDANVRGRAQLIKQFGPEVNRLNERLAVIDKELPDLKIQNVDKEVHVGPIIYIAKAFNTSPEEAVKWVILTIIFVFDPLAVALLIAGNMLIDIRKKQPKEEPKFIAEEIEVELPEARDPRDSLVQLVSTEEADKIRAEIQATPSEPGPLELLPIDPPVIGEHVEPWSEEKIQEFNEVLDKYEEPAKVEFNPSPDCDYCGGEGEHQIDGEVKDCDACTPQIEDVPVIDVVEPVKQHIKIEERDGREVISLETDLPKANLEKADVRLADIVPYNDVHHLQTMKLRTHYSE